MRILSSKTALIMTREIFRSLKHSKIEDFKKTAQISTSTQFFGIDQTDSKMIMRTENSVQ